MPPTPGNPSDDVTAAAAEVLRRLVLGNDLPAAIFKALRDHDAVTRTDSPGRQPQPAYLDTPAGPRVNPLGVALDRQVQGPGYGFDPKSRGEQFEQFTARRGGSTPVSIVRAEAPIPVLVVGGKEEHEREEARAGEEGPREGKGTPAGPGAQGGGTAGQVGAVLGAIARTALAGLSTVAGALASRFGAVLSPLSRLSTFLESTTSGMSLLNGAIRIFASSLAPVLLPITAVLATALISLSEVIWRELLPVLGEWYRWVVANAIPAIRGFIDTLKSAGQFLLEWAKKLGLVGRTPEEQAAKEQERERQQGQMEQARAGGGSFIDQFAAFQRLRLEDAQRGVASAAAGSGVGSAASGIGAAAGAAGGAAGGPAGGRGRDLRDPRSALDLVMQEFRRSVGPQANLAGLAERSRQLQLTSLQRSPFEQVMQDRMLEVIRKMDEAINELKEKPKPRLPQQEDS